MKTCVFLSMDSLDGYSCDDNLLFEPLKKFDWEVCPVSWHRQDVDWGCFDAVIIRSTWDYQKNPRAYLQVLEAINTSGARLENDIRLVRWNIEKTYLKDLEQKGIKSVPKRYGCDFLDRNHLSEQSVYDPAVHGQHC